VATLGNRVSAFVAADRLNEIAGTQAEHTAALAEHSATLAEHGGKLDRIIALVQER